MKLRFLLVIAAVWTLPAFAQEVVVYKVPAGKRFKLEVANEGKTAIEFESKDLKQEKVVAPGAKTSLSINALKAGEYKFVDEFHESTAKGKIIAK
jgi:hypothetical protein